MTKFTKEKLELLRKTGYSEKAINYLEENHNVGKIKNPDAVGEYTGKCGDTIRTYLVIRNNVIKDAEFIYTGCAGAGSSGSALTEIAKGRTVEEALKLSINDVVEHLKGGKRSLPPSKYDCCEIAIESLWKAIKQYQNKGSC